MEAEAVPDNVKQSKLKIWIKVYRETETFDHSVGQYA